MAFTDYRILGPLEVIREGERVPIGARKERTLLLCLLLHGNRVVPVDRLVDALWGERPAASAGKLLQHYVSNLRRKLGAAAITTAPPGYCAQLPADALDAERFEQLLREGRDARGCVAAAKLTSLRLGALPKARDEPRYRR